MTKTLATLAVAATLAAGAVAIPKDANAACLGCYVGAGVLGGALLGAAIASSAPPVYAAPAPVYAAPPPVYYAPPTCYYAPGAPVWDQWRGIWVRPQVRVCN